MERTGLQDLENLDADDLLRRLESSEPRRKKRRLRFEEEQEEDDVFDGLTEDGEENSSGGSVGVAEDPREAEDVQSADAEIDESSSDDEQEDAQEDKLVVASRTTGRASKEDAPRISLPTKPRIEDKQRLSKPTTSAPASSFVELGTSKPLVASLAGMSIRTPTEVQAACIPPLLAGGSQCYRSGCFIQSLMIY